MAKVVKASNPNPTSRLENILAYMAIGVIGTSLLAMFLGLLAQLLFKFSPEFLGVVMAVPFVGLPIGFILVLSLLLVNLRRRAKNNLK
jgi:hypothetical protein